MKSRRRKVSEEKRDDEVSNSLTIPVDLIIEIFSRLPAKSVAKCRCVSKIWASILGRPYFTELFFTRSSARPQLLFTSRENGELNFFSAPEDQNLDPIALNRLTKFPLYCRTSISLFCGSVRGLVCFSDVKKKGSCKRLLVICNPSTGQYLRLPFVNTKKKKPFTVFTSFGYDPIQKQYKVFLILADSFTRSEEHHLLTLGTGKLSWRKIHCCIPHSAYCRHVCINGLLYYLAQANSSWVVVCFDFTTEKFKVIKAAFFGEILVNYNGKLASLSSEGNIINGTSRSFEMRILENPEKHEWSKHVYEFPPEWHKVVGEVGEVIFRFAGVIGTNQIVLSHISHSLPVYLIYYNMETKTIRKVKIQETDAFRRYRALICVDHVEDVQLMEMLRPYNLRSW